MDTIVVEGGERLVGDVTISGAKNAALPLLAASILAEGTTVFENVPTLEDIRTTRKLLSNLGAKVEADEGKHTVSVDASKLTSHEAPYELVKTMRASSLALGPLLARLGKARVSLPGGCAIGARPINLHLMALEKMGAEIKIEHGYVEAKARKLKGAKIYFDIVTVTGTENIMMAASLAEGTTVLENAACEPEVVDTANLLNKMGARIRGAGTGVITIEGVSSLKPVSYRVMPDRIETGTFMIASALTRGNIKIKDCIEEHSMALINKLREAGVEIKVEVDGIRVIGHRRIKSVDVKTLPYPGFATDMQAQMMVLMTLGDGLSVITETVFENRFMHVSELQRMGADIRIDGHSALVKGVPYLSGAPVMATDLRASASLILAGLAAERTTEVSRVYHLDRGYERIEEKLSRLGAKIKRVK